MTAKTKPYFNFVTAKAESYDFVTTRTGGCINGFEEGNAHLFVTCL